MRATSTGRDLSPRVVTLLDPPRDLPRPANADRLALAGWRAARRKARQVDGPDRGDEVMARMRRRAAEDAALRAELATLRRILRAAGIALPRSAPKS